jgi:hypothetical protein
MNYGAALKSEIPHKTHLVFHILRKGSEFFIHWGFQWVVACRMRQLHLFFYSHTC